MKRKTTAIRLNEIMSERSLRQVDILKLTKPYCEKYGIKMNKSDISQYCSGKTEPNQEKLYVLGKALNVSEAWLMGFDVPMERINWELVEKQNQLDKSSSTNSTENFYQKQLLSAFNKLNDNNKKKVITYTENLLKVEEMEQEQEEIFLNAAHERTDIEVTEEMKQHDNDMMMNDDLWK